MTQTNIISGPAYDSYGNPTTVTLKTITTSYTSDSGVSYQANARPTQSLVTDQNNQTRKVTLSYLQQNGLWLVQNKDDYNAADDERLCRGGYDLAGQDGKRL